MQSNQFQTRTSEQAVTYDAGLRAHMNSVYSRMTLGVLVTALVSWFVAGSEPLLQLFLGGPQKWIVMLAPLAIIWFGFNPMTMDSRKLSISFFALAVVYGISFAVIFIAFTGESIAKAFFIATGMFAGLSIFGYTTKKNLDAIGSFAIMGIWGVLILSLINIFIGNSGLGNVISIVAIIAFAGLTAWQTQTTKEMYNPAWGAESNSRMAWSAALNLYISFIAMFQTILHFVGVGRGE
ncbi:MAG: BAX inhibitor (BI)-1/YccA family protein [Alphaproteobacteria bacterium]|nr:BAX inhibitor (BI)-1/YccA family protein [Alphaproteobacteria bacterium]